MTLICENCLNDTELKSIVHNSSICRKNTRCAFCGKKSEEVYDTEKDQNIVEALDYLLNIFKPASSLSEEYPQEEKGYLKDFLCSGSRWNIFNLSAKKTDQLLKEICKERYEFQPQLFDEPVGIPEMADRGYLEENSILKGKHWNDFVHEIKEVNRFHGNSLNTEKLYVFLQYAFQIRHAGQSFYRARICDSSNGYQPGDMSAPPHIKAKAGRVNAEGEPVLYLATEKETTLHEVRAGMYDKVTIGRFYLNQDIKVVNLANLNSISPFHFLEGGNDVALYAVNIEHLRKIANEIARPLHDGNVLDYLPTQYISDFIKSKGFDGIEYQSTMNPGGRNLAIFNPELLTCTETDTYVIQNINYSCKPILNC